VSTANEAWVWLDPAVLRAVHDEQLAEHGGAAGVRDEGLFESALARPQHMAAYGQPSVAELAAAYGWGLARNHPFIDGNKRTAFVAVELFLQLNGHELVADDAACVMTMLAVAAGDLPEADFAAWIANHVQPSAE
jgi:death-on-curing protein